MQLAWKSNFVVTAVAGSEEEEEFQLDDEEEELIDEEEEGQFSKEPGKLDKGYLTCIKSSFANNVVYSASFIVALVFS